MFGKFKNVRIKSIILAVELYFGAMYITVFVFLSFEYGRYSAAIGPLLSRFRIPPAGQFGAQLLVTALTTN